MTQALDKEREKTYRELAARIERQEKLNAVSQEMELRKNLMKKGAKVKVGRVYKWKAVRSK